MKMTQLLSFVQNHWPLTQIALTSLQNKGGRSVYKIDSQQGSFVLKLSNTARTYAQMKSDLYIFDEEKQHNFVHLPRLIKTKNKELIATYSDRFGFVMEYIEGENPFNTPENWEKIAQVTAKLHAIKNCPYFTPFSPETEKNWITSQAKNLSFGKAYLALFESLTDFSIFPKTFIHTDIGLHNCIQSKQGELFFLDWDDAGLGLRVLDIGFPLISQLISNSVIHEQNIRTFYQTYFANTSICVEPAEKKAIFDASLFFALIYLPYGNIDENWKKINYALENKDYLLSLLLEK